MSTRHGGERGVLLPRIGSLCTGYGGLDLGVAAALGGAQLAWCADNDVHVRAILSARFPGVPNLGDITSFDWRTVEPVEVLTAGFPCQDISSAGRGRGIEKGTRSGVWINVMEAVRVLRPGLLVVENVAALRWRGLGRVLGDLAEAGYDATWCSVRASQIGAPHRRERIFVAAHPTHHGHKRAVPAWEWRPGPPHDGVLATDPGGPGLQGPIPSQERCPATPEHRSGTPADAPSHRRNQGQPEPARLGRRPDAALGRGAAAADTPSERHPHTGPSRERRVQAAAFTGAPADPGREGRQRGRDTDGETPAAGTTGEPERLGEERATDWGPYEPAIRRWEQATRRAAPAPTEPGRTGRPRLSARFVEWVMGLPPGWVTDLDLPRTAQLRTLGNGVVPAQAAHALHLLAALNNTDDRRGREPAVRAREGR